MLTLVHACFVLLCTLQPKYSGATRVVACHSAQTCYLLGCAYSSTHSRTGIPRPCDMYILKCSANLAISACMMSVCSPRQSTAVHLQQNNIFFKFLFLLLLRDIFQFLRVSNAKLPVNISFIFNNRNDIQVVLKFSVVMETHTIAAKLFRLRYLLFTNIGRKHKDCCI